MDKIMLLVPAVALLALLFAAFTAKSILKMDSGNEDVKRISAIVRKGANAFLKKQYKTVIIFFRRCIYPAAHPHCNCQNST